MKKKTNSDAVLMHDEGAVLVLLQIANRALGFLRQKSGDGVLVPVCAVGVAKRYAYE